MALTLNAAIPFLSLDTPAYDAVLSNQVWLQTDQQLRRYSKNGNIFFILYKPSLWPWHLTQRTIFFSARHSGLWGCITVPGLVTKCSVVQKISSGQTFAYIIKLRCDLDLQRSNPIFPQGPPVCDAVLTNQVWLQMDQQFRRYSKNSLILII